MKKAVFCISAELCTDPVPMQTDEGEILEEGSPKVSENWKDLSSFLSYPPTLLAVLKNEACGHLGASVTVCGLLTGLYSSCSASCFLELASMCFFVRLDSMLLLKMPLFLYILRWDKSL
ncbi:uncharacterized protein LOC130607864 isoform X1 [Pezoporus wallicus]|uniref:uncharacterized protein LOC130607864 isoform X1 n=1 Tax=Pezoporus wallicus TaxID=35540 RepID=UPI00255048C5|nr:uncharacterized protein LOC130607864 isoform X1 [Pezoporus wallicus]